MSVLFGGPDDIAYFDQGFQAGVYAVMEVVVKKHPKLENEFHTIIEELLEKIIYKKINDHKNINISICDEEQDNE